MATKLDQSGFKYGEKTNGACPNDQQIGFDGLTHNS
jgi:hypothetical protein